ncbi:MAG TPA: glycosyltransferase, partial [Steroidobacteraceae bacterium]
DIVIFGLAITSAWGNGHATTYRALVRALTQRGHRVRFFERDVPWYARHRDALSPAWGEVRLYRNLGELTRIVNSGIDADLVMIGSYVPDGIALAEWVLSRTEALKAFYDIDTPVTLAQLERGDCKYLAPSLVGEFDLYLSFAGGPILHRLSIDFGAQCVRPFCCSVDLDLYHPLSMRKRWDLGYLGTYSPDRQPGLENLLLDPARQWSRGRFCVAGPQYPKSIAWPSNVQRIAHLGPEKHCGFYNSQRFTLNITRADMRANGYSPSVRLFEAAACGVPIISDEWDGIEDFFVPDKEILLARSSEDVLRILREMDDSQAHEIAARARHRVLSEHTAAHRAIELENYVGELRSLQLSQLPEFRRAMHGS